MILEFWGNFRHNLFKPLLLFFYMGLLVPILGVAFEFPHVNYQGLTIYLLVSIGWHGGEELARLKASEFGQALGFMGVGLATNFVIGILAYLAPRSFTRLRKVDAATVAGYYGSDSAGTFATCVGVLKSLSIPSAPYMPVMLAVMEIPGCLVALYLVSRLRADGMDAQGHMPDEAGYDKDAVAPSRLEGQSHGEGQARPRRGPVRRRTRPPKNDSGNFQPGTSSRSFPQPRPVPALRRNPDRIREPNSGGPRYRRRRSVVS